MLGFESEQKSSLFMELCLNCTKHYW